MKKKLLIPLFVAGMALPFALQHDEIAVAKGYFIGEFGSETAYVNHAVTVNDQMAEEGFVLLKNDGSLPLPEGTKLSVFGKASTNLSRGGSGSGAGSVNIGNKAYDLQKSLTEAGFVINDALTTFYKNDNKSGIGRTNGNSSWKGISQVQIGETPLSCYDDDLYADIDSFIDGEENKVAIQVITREGAEGCDVKTCDQRDFAPNAGGTNKSFTPVGDVTEKHALQLSDNEEDLFNMLKERFDKVIFIINSSNIFECDRLEKDGQVAGILWVGNVGDRGPRAIGRILSGEVNPSGRTVDTWARDFKKDPTFQNFSDNAQTNPVYDEDGNLVKFAAQDTMFAADGKPMLSYGTDKNYKNHDNPRWDDEDNLVVQGGINGVKPTAYVSYEEGVYVDYRYYETRYMDMAVKDKAKADKWYEGRDKEKGGVVYPFGYGLSYTTFSQELVKVYPAEQTALSNNNDVISVSVRVTNTGEVAGKDTVQLYWRAPYTAGGIEKADHVLCAFGKSKILEPQESDIVHLTFHLQDVANYDYTDANANEFKGYELDAGEYQVMLGKNAHEFYDYATYKVEEGGIQYRNDRFTGHEVVNRFTDRGFYSSMPGENDIEFTQMSRKDFVGTFPTHPTVADRTVKEESRYEEFLTHEFNISDIDVDHNYEYVPEAAYKTEADATAGGWTQNAGGTRIKLREMKEVAWDDPKWETYVNQASYAEMINIIETNGQGGWSQSSVGKNGFSEGDGPQQFSIIWWVSAPIAAATYNVELAQQQGECVGMESQIRSKSGWWGPAVNTHRSPFGGRNFEYYSADPFLMGRFAATVVKAATDRGIYCYFKHFAVNDQEKNRESGISFVNEQALREIYLKSFQMVFEEAKSTGVMGSYNRLGLFETATSYPLLTEVLRGEWGFKGNVLSDMTHSGNGSVNFKCYECVTHRNIAGCGAQLDTRGFANQTNALSWDSTLGAPTFTSGGQKVASYTWWYACRRTYKEIMFMCANATQTAKGLTNPSDAYDVSVVAGEEFSKEIVPATVGGKQVTSAQLSLNWRSELPAGVEFDNATRSIKGTVANPGVYRFEIIANVVYADSSQGTLAYKFVLRVTPANMEETGLVMDETNTDENGNRIPRQFPYGKAIASAPVGLIIGIAGGVVVLAAAAVVVVLLLKKKKKAA